MVVVSECESHSGCGCRILGLNEKCNTKILATKNTRPWRCWAVLNESEGFKNIKSDTGSEELTSSHSCERSNECFCLGK